VLRRQYSKSRNCDFSAHDSLLSKSDGSVATDPVTAAITRVLYGGAAIAARLVAQYSMQRPTCSAHDCKRLDFNDVPASVQNPFDAWTAATMQSHIRDAMKFSHLFVQQFSLVADRMSSYSGFSIVASRSSC
jgi:hypothetical protein